MTDKYGDYWFDNFRPEVVMWEEMREKNEEWKILTDAFDENWFQRKYKNYDYKFSFSPDTEIEFSDRGDYRINYDTFKIDIRISTEKIVFLVYSSQDVNEIKNKKLRMKDIKYQKLKKRVCELENKLEDIKVKCFR